MQLTKFHSREGSHQETNNRSYLPDPSGGLIYKIPTSSHSLENPAFRFLNIKMTVLYNVQNHRVISDLPLLRVVTQPAS
ncbi:hypothetical protein E2C01_074823 [Portunus trituberculatus]|uniref:Uncharacterized protein n=1 Tax=Portunus trituberculatus TaxID=210409 RepID=A0A5B7IEI3_PORTR|nr:hypothetical protein [Portunus trituberculatus]